MSDTPRTDAVFDDCEDSCGNPWEAVSAYFARQLERELAAAKQLAESNGKLAHDLGIKCRELQNQLNFLSDQFLTEKKTMSEPPRTAYSLKEISEKLNRWMIDQWGDSPKDLDPHRRDQFYRDNGLIYHFLSDHFPTEKQTKP